MAGIGLGSSSSYMNDDFFDNDFDNDVDDENSLEKPFEEHKDISNKNDLHKSDSDLDLEIADLKESTIKNVSKLLDLDGQVDAGETDDKVVDYDIVDENYSDEIINRAGSPFDVKYKSGDVAKMCNQSEQMIRNYTKTFAEFLNVEVKNSHRFYSYEDVKTLKLIFNLREKRKFTIQQTLDFMRGGASELASVSDNENANAAIALLLNSIEDKIGSFADNLEKLIEKKYNDNLLLLQDSLNLQNNSMVENEKIIAKNEEVIKENNELILKSSEIIGNLEQVIEGKNSYIQQLESLNSKYEDLLNKTIEQNDDINSKLDSMKEKKKKWFFK